MIKSLILSSILLLSSILPSFSQAPVVSKAGPYTPLGYCQITSLGSAVFLVTASCATGSVPAGATIAEICVSTQTIRYRDDGVAPTTSVGMPVAPNSSTLPNCFSYAIIPMTAMQLIAVTGSPTIDISFYK
jgi:hypothetical protein